MSVSFLSPVRDLKNLSSTTGLGGMNESVVLNQLGPVSFHWADFQDSCRSLQERMAHDALLKSEYNSKLAELEKLHEMPVWIRSGKMITHTTLFNLYQGFILESLWREDVSHPHAPYDISFISPSGPYKKLAVTECFNLQTYQDFIHIYLLQNKLPQRDFRLRSPSRLLAEFGNGFNDVGVVDLEQVSSTGLLLKCPSKLYFKRIRPSGQMRLLFGSQALEESISGWGLNPFYTQNKKESFVLNCDELQMASRFDYGSTQDVYLFVRFDSLRGANALIAQKLERFIKRTRDEIRGKLKTSHVA